MFSRVVNWAFSKTRPGQIIDGHKTVIGFGMYVLALVIQGLAAATGAFPEVAGIAETHAALSTLHTSIGEWLHSFGVDVMLIGLGHKAIKASGNGSGGT